jgi:transposase
MGLLVLWSTEMHALSPSQQSKLLANRNVLEVSEKSVSYTPAFKIKAIHQFIDGVSPDQIFSNAGIPINFFKEDYCRYCLKRWVQKFRARGEESLHEDGRGSSGRPKKERPEDLTYDELLSLVEIQKGALEELKKQNALERKKKR